MTRQEVEVDIAAAEARSAALFARLDERIQGAILRIEARLDQTVSVCETAARNAEASAQRAEQSAGRAEESARLAQESARRAEEHAARASHASMAYFLSLIAVAGGLYFGVTRAFKHDMEVFTTAIRTEQRADMREFVAVVKEARGEIKGSRQQIDHEQDQLVRERLQLEQQRKHLDQDRPRSAPR